MGETDNIARMAQKVSDDIFEIFGWKQVGPINQNWSCASETHGAKTHPSDVVLWYDDPYRSERIFWNVDLKSYAASSITKASVAGAVSTLGRSAECANVSTGWQELFADTECAWRCDGLLFIYNHDGEFDRNFPKLLADIDSANFRLPAKRRMAIVGPPEVGYLVNVAADIVAMRGKKQLPLEPAGSQFWYPDLVRPKRREQSVSAATIEMLTGPWITLRAKPEQHGGKLEFFVWYRGRGDSVEEFKYLLDSFFRYQMLSVDSEAEVNVRLVDPAPIAVANFGKAKDQFSSSMYGLPQARLDRVRCESVPHVHRRFSEVEIGMEAR